MQCSRDDPCNYSRLNCYFGEEEARLDSGKLEALGSIV